MAAGRLSVMREGELLATLADVLPVNHGIAYLAGSRHTRNRVSVMQVALGRRVIQAEAGINALRETLRVALGIEPASIASVEREIATAVLEFRRDRAKAETMTADDILKVWAKW